MMSIEEVVASRGIEEIVHFTTRDGIVGIVHQWQCKARKLLKQDESLEHILKLNTEKEFDPEWKEYVNLSISRINPMLFGYSTYTHHDAGWHILVFDPSILAHDGVLFSTTNNAYRQHLKRGSGVAGLEELFAPVVAGRYGNRIQRPESHPEHFTTDVQAEVLYPRAVALDFLRCIYVRTEEEADRVCGIFSALGKKNTQVRVETGKFE